jgi:hypothetical protein
MNILDVGMGVLFAAVGFILALSKSAKGSSVLTLLLGLVGGWAGVAVSGSHAGSTEQPRILSGLSSESVGWLVLSIGLGTILGLLGGLAYKAWAVRRGFDPGIGMLMPTLKKAAENKQTRSDRK